MDSTSDTILRQLVEDYWERRKFNEPLLATALGDRRFDGRLSDITPKGRERVSGEYKAVLARAMEILPDELSDADRLTRSALLVDAESAVDYISCGLDEWTVDPLGGPQVEMMNVESYQPVRTPEEGKMMVARWSAMGPYLGDHVENLRHGLGEGKVAVRALVSKVIEEIDDVLEKRDEDWPLLLPVKVQHEDWPAEVVHEFRTALNQAVSGGVRPGLEAYVDFLKSKVLPIARPDTKPGIMHVEGGLETYRRLVRVHTSLELAPETLHSTGLSEVAKINREMESLGEKALGTPDRQEILRRLREDKSLYFTSRDEVAEKAEKALARSRAAIPAWFGRLPKADCEVIRMKEHEEKHSTIAYYRPPAEDGTRPGRYYINTSAPETRPRYEAEALAYHESIPGHHLQIAIAQELEGIPEFRRNSGVTAFIEGWGLYSERLSDEMGLYSSDLDRIGMLSYDSWRACRLVVDTGMHAMGWTRERAIEFMVDNSALARNNIVNEVDRYITWPGQALAYKTGQLEILRLRRESEERLGGKFDIKEFHDAVLCNGAVPLQSLRQVVDKYVLAKT